MTSLAVSSPPSSEQLSDASSTRPSLPWMGLREELKLSKGPSTRHGSATWTIHDPVTNQFFRIGWMEFEMLSRWSFGDADKIVSAINKTTPMKVTKEQIELFSKFLQHNNLLRQSFPGAGNLFLKKQTLSRQGIVKSIFKNYLYFKIPMVHPDRFLSRTLPLINFVFTSWFIKLIMGVSLLGLYLIAKNWAHFINGFNFMTTPDGAIAFMSALIISKICHELGHGYAAKRYGCTVPKMGIGVIVFWPILWTDTTDAWRVADKKSRLIISGAGIYAEMVVAAFASLAWALMEDGALRSSMQMLAATTWILTATVNLNPIMKFDGYFLISDWIEIPNLQTRSILFFRWWFRHLLYGFTDPPPEYPDIRDRRFMILYAFSSWVYRFFIMISIALAIYFFFFKALGLLLISIQLLMFPIIPFISEIKLCWKMKQNIKWFPNFFLTLIAVAAILSVFLVPWRTTITVPSLMMAEREHVIYSPVNAKIKTIFIHNGQSVKKSQALFQLDSPDLVHHIQQTQRRIRQIEQQMAANQVHDKRIELNTIMIEEYHTLQADLMAYLEEQNKLTIKAPFDGWIRDFPDYLHAGDWIIRKEVLGLLVQSNQPRILAFIPERQLPQISLGQQVYFYPHGFQFRGINGHTSQINDSAVHAVRYPEIASVFGGDLPVQRDIDGNLVPVGSHYGIEIESTGKPLPVERIVTGDAEITTQPASLISRFWTYALGVLIRESGL